MMVGAKRRAVNSQEKLNLAAPVSLFAIARRANCGEAPRSTPKGRSRTVSIRALRQVVHVNVKGRVAMLCFARGISDQRRQRLYANAVGDALVRRFAELPGSTGQLREYLDEQMAFLEAALEAAEQRRSERVASGPAHLDESAPPEHGDAKSRPSGPNGTACPQTLEEKLKQARKPLSKLLREDCVQLGLVNSERAEELVKSLAGRTPAEGEARVVEELRNNLHAQVRRYIRKHRGGPWPSPMAQDELRVDIAATRGVVALLSLTRGILRERVAWERSQKKGVLGTLLSGLRSGS